MRRSWKRSSKVITAWTDPCLLQFSAQTEGGSDPQPFSFFYPCLLFFSCKIGFCWLYFLCAAIYKVRNAAIWCTDKKVHLCQVLCHGYNLRLKSDPNSGLSVFPLCIVATDWENKAFSVLAIFILHRLHDACAAVFCEEIMHFIIVVHFNTVSVRDNSRHAGCDQSNHLYITWWF